MTNRLARYSEGVMEACWLLALIVAPLFFNIYSSRVFEPDKIALVRSLALVALAAWLIKLISEGGPRFENVPAQTLRSLRGWRQIPLLIPVAALVVVYLISTALSIAPNISLFGSYQRLQGTFSTFSYIALFLVIIANLRRRAQIDRLITVVAVTSLPISLYAILQRYQLDPLPWGGDTVERVTGHMGNAIFVAAYLIMAALAVLGRVVSAFRAVMVGGERLWLHTLRAAVYVFIFAVSLVAIWFTQSRGPQLGLVAGIFFFFILVAMHYRARRLVLGTVAVGVLVGAFLIVLNIPNGPLTSLAEVRGVSRLAHVFDEITGNTGTGRVRVLIWTGVVKMMTPHTPLVTPDGSPDPWNLIRPLVGYGPEAMLVAYNRFYPPELGDLEARNASPDRSHNETFDALAFTGVLGLIVQMSLFVALFYYGLKWLGLIGSPVRRNIFLAFVLGGGALCATGFVLWQGPQFFGVSLPLGMVLGLLGFLTLYALLPPPANDQPLESWRALTIISLFAAIVAHFTEIHFGIAIVSTRTHFWIFAGALVVVGYIFDKAGAKTTAEKETPAAPVAASAARAGRPASGGGRRRAAGTDPARPTHEPFLPVAWTLGLMAPVMITLGFNFVTNSSRALDPFNIIWNALTQLPSGQTTRPSVGILSLILITWVFGIALTYIEETREAAQPSLVRGIAASLGLSFLVVLLAWMIQAGVLAQIASFAPQNIQELQASVGLVAGILALYYAFLMLALLGWAAGLAQASAAPTRGRAATTPLAWAAYLGLPVVGVLLAIILNLQVIQADIVYKTGLQFDDQGQPQVAIELFKRTLELAPSQDFYYLFLGRSYLNASGTVAADQRDALFDTAEKELLQARSLNPLNTDHTANLARLNRQWAVLTTDAAARSARAQKADTYYGQALSLSPNNSGLWNEWALLAYQLLSNNQQAQAYLDKSLALDPKFDQTYWYQGDLYQSEARVTTDPAAQKKLYDQSVNAYRQGLDIGQKTGRAGSTLNLHLGLAGVYVATNQVQPAITEYQQAAQVNAGANQWQIYRALGELYRQTNDLAQAKAYGQQALSSAPDAEKPNLQKWLAALP